MMGAIVNALVMVAYVLSVVGSIAVLAAWGFVIVGLYLIGKDGF